MPGPLLEYDFPPKSYKETKLVITRNTKPWNQNLDDADIEVLYTDFKDEELSEPCSVKFRTCRVKAWIDLFKSHYNEQGGSTHTWEKSSMPMLQIRQDFSLVIHFYQCYILRLGLAYTPYSIIM